MEIAGVVSKPGSDKNRSLVGRSLVSCKSGGHSSQGNVPAEQLFVIDDKWLNVAAAIPVNYLTCILHDDNCG